MCYIKHSRLSQTYNTKFVICLIISIPTRMRLQIVLSKQELIHSHTLPYVASISVCLNLNIRMPQTGLSKVHVHNLNPGCMFGHVKGVISICTWAQICTPSNFAPTAEVVQSYLDPSEKCAYEREMFNITHLIGNFDI